MNSSHSLWFAAALVAAMLPASARGQASPDPSPSAIPHIQFQHFRALTPEERTALAAAGDKARHDPQVRAAADRLHQAAQEFDDAMIAKDESLEPILEKIRQADGPGASPHSNLTADEREELRIDRQEMQGSPEANELASATTNYRKAEVQALSAANPSLAGIVSRLPNGDRGLGFRRLIAPSPTASGTAAH